MKKLFCTLLLMFICSPLTAQTWWEDAPNAVPDYKKREWLHWYDDSGPVGTIDLAEDLEPPAADEPWSFWEALGIPFRFQMFVGRATTPATLPDTWAVKLADNDAVLLMEEAGFKEPETGQILGEGIIELKLTEFGWYSEYGYLVIWWD